MSGNETKLCFTCGIRPRHVSKNGKSQSYCYECATVRSKLSKDKNHRKREYATRDPRKPITPKPKTTFGKAPETRMNADHTNDQTYQLRCELIQSRYEMATLRKAAIKAILLEDFNELETILSPYLGEGALQ